MTSKNIFRGDVGAGYLTIDQLTFGADYPAGGYTLSGYVPLNTILSCVKVGCSSGFAGYETCWVPSGTPQTGALQILVQTGTSTAALAQIAASLAAISGATATLLSIGY